jgi:hypothetical protein
MEEVGHAANTSADLVSIVDGKKAQRTGTSESAIGYTGYGLKFHSNTDSAVVPGTTLSERSEFSVSAWIKRQGEIPRYVIYDDDEDTTNHIAAISDYGSMRSFCTLQGGELPAVTSAEQIIQIRDLLRSAGYDLNQPGGIPLGYDFDQSNSYKSMGDSSKSVDFAFNDLVQTYHWNSGDFDSDTDVSQNCAGLGFTDFGIHNWNCYNPSEITRALICEFRKTSFELVGVAPSWRIDGRCGEKFPAANGDASQCIAARGDCCSAEGWCGSASAQCDCLDCSGPSGT